MHDEYRVFNGNLHQDRHRFARAKVRSLGCWDFVNNLGQWVWDHPRLRLG